MSKISREFLKVWNKHFKLNWTVKKFKKFVKKEKVRRLKYQENKNDSL